LISKTTETKRQNEAHGKSGKHMLTVLLM